ncbi:MAG: hypothetical protein PVH17_08930, partial [Anaerolineae bacterium]
LSPIIEKVVLKALAKRPEHRFQRGAEMVAALRSALAGRAPKEPVAAARRSPIMWVMAGIAMVLLLVLGGLALLLGGGEEAQTPVPATTQAVVKVTPTELPHTLSPTATGALATESPPPPTDTPLAPTPTLLPPTHTPLLPTDTPIPPTKPPDAKFGRLAFTSNRHGNHEIYVVNLAGGNPVRLTNNSANDWLPDWSPGGQGAARIAFTSNRTGSHDLWVMNADGSGQVPLVTTEAWDDYARWAPGGSRLAFSTTALTQGAPNSEIHIRRPNGQLVRRTTTVAEDQWPDWSPDGRIIYAEGFKGTSGWDIYITSADGSGRTVWLGGPACDVQPVWLTDGDWIAFIRIPRDTNGNGQPDELDAGDVWVGRADGGSLRQLTSGLWAVTPAWSPNGDWIAFTRIRDSNGNMLKDEDDASDIWAVPFSGGDPVPLVVSPHQDWGPSWTW